MPALMEADNKNGGPAENETSSLIDQLNALSGGIHKEMDKLARHRRDLVRAQQGRLAKVDAQLRKYQKILRALDDDARPRIPRAKGSDSKRVSVSDNSIVPVAEAILAWPEETFTVLGIHHEALGNIKSEATTYDTFKYLRAIEFIGKVGKERTSDGHSRDLYKIFDADAIDQLKVKNAT